ncbi:AcrR family transcriptional regulator [Crossiella equi]|uniref:AcrR family transcriptional regulator n=1 Tax=Crossiella equi TaxID=130796 RepID=A0ABS5ABL3_9PSEU|nr:TetR/AcrR family transcriptional regulator [Crossiella equi]MBP2473968.1 AcrR family transcriptional regulator [Crossiella equi]
MPKQVDHEERRQHIAGALWRIVSRHGMEAVSLRDVAAEAGVSMGSVQHYFRSKDRMLEFALEFSSQKVGERVRARLAREWADGEPAPWVVLRATLLETLPLDEQARTGRLVANAYFMRAVHEPAMRSIYLEGQPKLFAFFADMIRKGRELGVTAPGTDPDREAVLLWGMTDSLGSDMLLGRSSAAESVELLDYYLRRLFPGVAESDWPPAEISTPGSTPEPTNSTP